LDPRTVTADDLSHLPVLYRRDLLKLGNDVYVAPEPGDEPLFSRFSSGTTGIPFKICYSERELIMTHIPLYFRHPVFEKLPLNKILSRKPFVVLGLPGFSYVCQKDFFSNVFPSITPADLDNVEIRKEIYRSIINAAPAILVGFGSLVTKLAYWIPEDKVSLPILAIRISSESVSAIERKEIENNLKAPVANMLSGNGTGFIGFECPTNQERFHVNSENTLLDIVNDNGNTLPYETEGELVSTSLGFTITPIVRFAHNDSGQLLHEVCGCGRTLPLFAFHGRRDYEIVLPSGNHIRWILLHTSLMRAGLGRLSKQIQIRQDRLDRLRILIVPKRIFSAGEEIDIRLACTSLFNNEKINIIIEYVNDIAHSDRKIKFFIPLSDSNKKDSQEEHSIRLTQ
jgi:phenylacetate-CoA ligase